MSSSKFEEFLRNVTSKVKSKEAHEVIKMELTHHLQQLSQSFQKAGFSQEEADERAIKEMGNPFSIGENLNRLHKPKMDWVLIALFVIIAGISFLPLIGGVPELFVFSTFFLGRQAIWFILAVLVILVFLFFDYRKLQNRWMFFYGSGLVLLLYSNGFGYIINGVKKWIWIFGFKLDASPLTLFLFFIAWAGIVNKLNEFNSKKKFVFLCFLFWIPILFYMMIPNIMFSIYYCFCIVTMFAFSHVQKKLAVRFWLANMAVGVVFITTIITTGDYFFARQFPFNIANADPNGEGDIFFLIKDILSQAGWFGNGLYNNINIQHSLPAAHTDFVFPYLVYSLGWAFGIILCFILMIFISRITVIAFKTKDLFGRLLVIGGAALFTVPTCWNILMGFGIVPIMGVSLPFISYGGSMLLFYSAILGLNLNIYRRKDIIEPSLSVYK